MSISIPSWAQVKANTQRCLRRTREWCQHLWHRLTHEPGYAEAVAALLLAAFDLFVRGEAARRLLTEVVRTFLAVIRSLLRDGTSFEEGYWA